jgi:hypothetical protein
VSKVSREPILSPALCIRRMANVYLKNHRLAMRYTLIIHMLRYLITLFISPGLLIGEDNK